MNLLRTLVRFSRSHRKGSPTVEFVMVIPFFILMALVVWQMAVAGMAVMDTQAALRDSVRVAAMTQNEDEASQQAYKSFGENGSYRISDLEVDIGDENAVVRATTEVDLIFLNVTTPIQFEHEAEAPILETVLD